MKKVYADKKVVAAGQRLEDLVMPKPKQGYQNETDYIGYKTPGLNIKASNNCSSTNPGVSGGLRLKTRSVITIA